MNLAKNLHDHKAHQDNTGILTNPEYLALLSKTTPAPRLPNRVCIKKISVDMIFAALDSCNSLGNGELYHQVISLHGKLGYQNLNVYHGLILGKADDAIELHAPQDPTAIPCYGKLVPKEQVAYAYLLTMALRERIELVSNRQQQLIVRIYLANVLSYLAYMLK